MKNVKTTLKNGQILTIREATPKDAEAVLTYLALIGTQSDNLDFGPEGLGYTVEEEAGFIEAITLSDNGKILMGFIGRELVSVAHLAGKSKRPRTKHAATLAISVIQSHWHLGIGDAMLGTLIAWAKTNPILRVLDLEVRADNAAAIALYEKHGFVRSGRFPQRFRIEGVSIDTLLMTKEITHD
jgi:ribosomal protein S18 acetylase RimI-like enzyme